MRPHYPLLATLQRLRSDRRGATAVITGILSIATLGFVGLGTDLGVAYAQRRAAQSAADSAAYSAAVAHMAGATNASDQGRSVAATYGFTDGVRGTRVTVAHPTSGPLAGDPRAFEVTVHQPMRRFISGMFDKKDRTVGARAVAVAGTAGNGCIIAFNPTDSMTALNNGSGAVNLNNCSVYVNSTHAQGFAQNGAGAFSALSYNLVGPNFLKNGSGTMTGPVLKSQPPIADPYANVPLPPLPASCDFTNKSYTATGEIAPASGTTMRFCGNLTLSGIGKTFTFKPGVTYFITDGTFFLNAINSTVIAENVTFVLTKGPGGTYGRVTFNGTTNTLRMSAPTSGPTAGLLFFQDPGATLGLANVINGKANASRLTGALYFKQQQLEINGVGGTVDSNCTQVLADKVLFNGATSTFKMDCAGTGVRSVGGFKTALVE